MLHTYNFFRMFVYNFRYEMVIDIQWHYFLSLNNYTSSLFHLFKTIWELQWSGLFIYPDHEMK